MEETQEYDRYLASISQKLPKQLLKYYNESYSHTVNNRFHDCEIKELCFCGKSNVYFNEKDTIRLVLTLGRKIEYDLVFSDIKSIKLGLPESNLLSVLGNIYGEILDCRLGISENDNYVFKFKTSTDMEVYIEYKIVRIEKRRII